MLIYNFGAIIGCVMNADKILGANTVIFIIIFDVWSACGIMWIFGDDKVRPQGYDRVLR